MISKTQLLSVLPPFNNRSILIESAQDVPDIIREVVEAHKHFGNDYDFIWQFFDRGSVRQICLALYSFCKRNIFYQVETDSEQTTKSPAAILAMGYGDCKHYAGFIAGVLDAINRNTGADIDWNYRFASYNWFVSDPGHVFIVVNDNGNEIWIDPCLKNFDDRSQYPSYIIDKKIKAMPLYRVSGLPGEMGFIDPGVAINVATSAFEFIKNFGDQVPNYPIKTQSTLRAIQEDLASQIPLPPKDVAEADKYYQYALQKQQEFAAKGGNVDTTKAMMYGEIAAALKNYIISAGETPGRVTTATAGAKSTNTLLIAGGALVAGYLLLRPKGRVSGKGSLLLPLGIAVAAYFLFFNKKDQPPAVNGIGQAVNNCLY